MTLDYSLPALPYAPSALEPVMDERTVSLHHDLHHQGYVDGANAALAELSKARESGDFKLVEHWTKKLAFHAGGHQLHSIFWTNLAPVGTGGAQVAGCYNTLSKCWATQSSQVCNSTAGCAYASQH